MPPFNPKRQMPEDVGGVVPGPNPTPAPVPTMPPSPVTQVPGAVAPPQTPAERHLRLRDAVEGMLFPDVAAWKAARPPRPAALTPDAIAAYHEAMRQWHLQRPRHRPGPPDLMPPPATTPPPDEPPPVVAPPVFIPGPGSF